MSQGQLLLANEIIRPAHSPTINQLKVPQEFAFRVLMHLTSRALKHVRHSRGTLTIT